MDNKPLQINFLLLGSLISHKPSGDILASFGYEVTRLSRTSLQSAKIHPGQSGSMEPYGILAPSLLTALSISDFNRVSVALLSSGPTDLFDDTARDHVLVF